MYRDILRSFYPWIMYYVLKKRFFSHIFTIKILFGFIALYPGMIVKMKKNISFLYRSFRLALIPSQWFWDFDRTV